MINRLISLFRMLGRVLKNLFLRPFKTVYSRIKYFFSAGRLVSAVPSAAKKLPKILKTKPEKREDYFDWGSFYIAKSLVLIVAIVIVVAVLVYIFLLHPLLTSWFWVKNFVVDDSDLSSYSGRVCVYYDEEYEELEFQGRLKDGKATEYGEEYYENGRYKYVGEFADGAYEGEGIQYYEDGSVMYRGEFSGGKYNGVGEYTDEDGNVYSGTFEKGKLTGSGTLTVNGVPYYEGGFSDGKINGEGKLLYSDGTVQYSGTFTDGLLNGLALEYYPGGAMKYNGSFTAGLYNGNGVMYSESGNKLYSGSFEMGQYSGNGTLYDTNGIKLYTGEFEKGVYSGSGTLYGSDGSVTAGSFADGKIVGAAERTFLNGIKYDGCFSDNMMNGTGTLSDVTGAVTYSGLFLDDDYDYRDIIGADPNDVKAMMPSLVQRVESDCFYLIDSSFGTALKCDFASSSSSASVIEMFARPISGSAIEIQSAKDIIAPNASSVREVENALLPTWAAAEFGIAYDSVKCYAASYDSVTVYYWTDSLTGKLLLKSADNIEAFVPIEADPADSGSDTGLTYDEIVSLFEELGLDIDDFASLGFDVED